MFTVYFVTLFISFQIQYYVNVLIKFKHKEVFNVEKRRSENSSDKDKIYTVNKYVVNQRLQRVYDISFRELILFSHLFLDISFPMTYFYYDYLH